MIERDCPQCGSTYLADPVRLRHGRQTTCSRACSYALRAAARDRQVRLECAFCGADFNRSPSHVKGQHGSEFCSRECHYAGRSAGLSGRVVEDGYTMTPEGLAALRKQQADLVARRIAADNYGHTEATRAKLADASARALAEGRVERISGLEHQVAAELDALGVSYTRQYGLRDELGRYIAVLDFFLDDLGVALEVNGTYWHADPRAYAEDTLNATQRHNLARYASKQEALAVAGIPLVEVWELDLKQSPREAVLEAYRRATAD